MAKRRPNWAASEIEKLVECCVSRDKSDMLWRDTTEMVNSVGGNNRGEEEVSRKWTDLKSQTKIKERKRRHFAKGTGGGPPPKPLLSWEELIVNILPVEVIEGLEGGTDTFLDGKMKISKKNFQVDTSEIGVCNASSGPVASTSIVIGGNVEKEDGKIKSLKKKSIQLDTSEIGVCNVISEPVATTSSVDEGNGEIADVNIEAKKNKISYKLDGRKRKVLENTPTFQEKLLKLEEEKLIIKQENLQIEKEKLKTLQKMSKDLSQIHVLLKHKIVEDDIIHQFLEQ